MSRSRSWLFLLAWVGAVSATSNLLADILTTESVTNSGSSTEHEVDLLFPGNLTGFFGSFINAFAGGSTSVNYSAGSNTTTLSFLDAVGGTGILPSASATFGFDYAGSSDSPNSQVGVESTSGDLANPTPIQLPALTVGINPPSSGVATQYVISFAQVTAGGQTTTSWFEVPYVGPNLPQISFQNDSNVPLTLSDVGFQLSNTMIPLDNLNFNDEPPSSFTPVPDLPNNTPQDPTTIGASSYDIVNLPEPSGVVLLALGALGLIGCRMCRRRRRAQ
jgi:hypothetical protein